MATIAPIALVGQIPTWKRSDGAYVWVAGFDIDADGAGGNPENDPDFQPTTTLKHSDGTCLNLRIENVGVIPGAWARERPEIIMGSLMRATNPMTGRSSYGVAGDIGPDDKIGEGSYAWALALGIPPSPITGGTQQPVIYWELWAGTAARLNGMQYQLQPL